MSDHARPQVHARREHGLAFPGLLPLLVPLVLIYCLVLASDHPWDIAIGTAVGIVVLAISARFGSGSTLAGPPSLASRIMAFPIFAAVAVYDVIRGTFLVAAIVVGVRPLRHPGIVAVPIGERSALGVAVSSLVTTLSPGSFLVDVDWAERTMLIHVIDASDPDQIRAELEAFYQRFQRRVFP